MESHEIVNAKTPPNNAEAEACTIGSVLLWTGEGGLEVLDRIRTNCPVRGLLRPGPSDRLRSPVQDGRSRDRARRRSPQELPPEEGPPARRDGRDPGRVHGGRPLVRSRRELRQGRPRHGRPAEGDLEAPRALPGPIPDRVASRRRGPRNSSTEYSSSKPRHSTTTSRSPSTSSSRRGSTPTTSRRTGSPGDSREWTRSWSGRLPARSTSSELGQAEEKTTYALELVRAAARAGVPVALASLEMGREELLPIMLCGEARIGFRQVDPATPRELRPPSPPGSGGQAIEDGGRALRP